MIGNHRTTEQKKVFIVLVVQLLNRVCLWNPMDWSLPGSSVLHCLLKFAQIHVHWVSGAIQPSYTVTRFSSWPWYFPAPGSFPMSWFFVSGGQSIGASAPATVFPVNNQGWFPLRLTDWLSLQSKGPSRVFSNTTVQKHLFFGALSSIFHPLFHSPLSLISRVSSVLHIRWPKYWSFSSSNSSSNE